MVGFATIFFFWFYPLLIFSCVMNGIVIGPTINNNTDPLNSTDNQLNIIGLSS